MMRVRTTTYGLAAAAALCLVVDLTDVTFIDSAGEAVLSFFSRLGAKFVALDAYMLDVCERLHLALARTPKAG